MAQLLNGLIAQWVLNFNVDANKRNINCCEHQFDSKKGEKAIRLIS